MDTKAVSGLTIGLGVAFLAILLLLHVLEPEFNPPHVISEYQLGRFGWLMSLAFVCLGAASLALFPAARQQIRTERDASGPGGYLSSASPISWGASSLPIQNGFLAAGFTASGDWSSPSARPSCSHL